MTTFLYDQAMASYSFFRHDLVDDENDLIELKKENKKDVTNHLQNSIVRSIANSSIDILHVTYSKSDNILNLTMWLSNFISNPQIDYIEYGMFIDTDKNNQSDYQLQYSWNNFSSKWVKSLKEWSSLTNHDRILMSDPNTQDFFQKDKTFVSISLDLELITNPETFDIVLYSNYMHKDYGFIDPSPVIRIPPPVITISPSSNPVILRVGDEKIVNLQLNTSDGMEANATLFVENHDNQNSFLSFTDRNKKENSKINTTISSSGLTNIPLKIKALDVEHPTIIETIKANISFPFRIDRLCECWGPEQNNFDLKSSINTKQVNLVLEILPALSPLEQINETLTTWVEPINGLYSLAAALGGGISTLIISTLRKKRKNNRLRKKIKK